MIPNPNIGMTYHTPNPATDIFTGDCRSLMSLLQQQFDLIFADPPFDYGVPYSTWKDNLGFQKYVAFTKEWLDETFHRLSDQGTLVVNVPDEIVSVVDMYCMSAGLTRVNWCIWHYRFGQCTRGRYIRSKVHVLHFVKSEKDRIWNPDAILVPSDRATTYADSRTQKTATPGERVPLDVWCNDNDGDCWGRVQGNNKERQPAHPNQLPEKYLERVVRACSNKDSWILDPFLGSGTTLAVARTLGRRSVGIEISPSYAQSAFERVRKGALRV